MPNFAPSSRLTGGFALFGAASLLSGCVVTNPHWGYEPDSISTPIPFQAWTSVTGYPVVVECATETTGHGSPANGEASYIVAGTIPVGNVQNYDSEGAVMRTASKMITLPSQCWDYFGSYDFWQANIRVSQLIPKSGGGTTKHIFSSFDGAGLQCLGSKNGQAKSWTGFVNQGCEKTYLNSSEKIPYIVLRIDGYANGTNASVVATAQKRNRPKRRAPRADKKDAAAAKVASIKNVTPNQLKQLRKGLRMGLSPTQLMKRAGDKGASKTIQKR